MAGGDGSETVGAVIFTEDFSGTTKYLGTGMQDGFGGTEYSSGALGMEADPREGFTNFVSAGTMQSCEGTDCSMPDVAHEDLKTAVVDVDALQATGPTNAPYGIACDYTGTSTIDHFIGLTITSDAHQHAIFYTYWPSDSNQSIQMLGGSQFSDVAPAIKTGLNQVNHLRAVCGSQALALYVNGTLVASSKLSQPLNPDTAGIALIGAPSGNDAATFGFVNLKVSQVVADPSVDTSRTTEFVDLLQTDDGIWSTGGTNTYNASFTQGAYQVDVKKGTQIAEAPFIWTPRNDQIVDSEVTFLDGGANSSGGVECRDSNNGNYHLLLGTDGSFEVGVTSNGSSKALVDWADPAPAANRGANQLNFLELSCVGDQITAYVNEQQVASVTDSSITFGNAALVTTAASDGDASYSYSLFSVDYPAE